MQPQRIILITDHNRELCDVAADALNALGAEVLRAYDGCEAMAVLDSRPIDLVLVDLTLPGPVGGDAVVARARQKGSVIITTGVNGTSGPDGIDGACSYLEKPFRVAALRGLVESALSERLRL